MTRPARREPVRPHVDELAPGRTVCIDNAGRGGGWLISSNRTQNQGGEASIPVE